MQGIVSYLNLKKRKEKSNCASKSLFTVEYHNPFPALLKLVALREYKNIQSGRNPDAVCSMQCTTSITEPGGHILFLPASRPGLMFAHQYLNGAPVSDTHTRTHGQSTHECIQV